MSGQPDPKPSNGRTGPKLERRRFDWDEARMRYEAGEDTVRLAREYGVSPTAVQTALRRMGVALIPHWKRTAYPKNLADFNQRLKASTHCKKGHEYTSETTYIKRNQGYVVRECRVCRREKVNAQRAALRSRGIKRLKGWHLSKKGELPICRNCGGNDRVELHHAIPRSKCRATRSDLRNGIPLCFSCHRGWHASKVVIYRDVFTRDEWAYISSAELTGEQIGPWLDKHYPQRPVEAAA